MSVDTVWTMSGYRNEEGRLRHVTTPVPIPAADEPSVRVLARASCRTDLHALSRANVPDGVRLGIYGFGSSAHITAQLALAAGIEVHVSTRGERHRAAARRLGVASVGGSLVLIR